MDLDDLPFAVTENANGSFTFDWDENHPVTSLFNNWTEEDWLDAISKGLQEQILDKQDNA